MVILLIGLALCLGAWATFRRAGQLFDAPLNIIWPTYLPDLIMVVKVVGCHASGKSVIQVEEAHASQLLPDDSDVVRYVDQDGNEIPSEDAEKYLIDMRNQRAFQDKKANQYNGLAAVMVIIVWFMVIGGGRGVIVS